MSIVKRIQIVGHVCHDLVQEGYILGGTASYSSIMATHLAEEVHLLTSFGPDFMFEELFTNASIKLKSLPSSRTTVFENIYDGGNRTQFMHNRATPINEKEISELQPSEVTLFCPIANEINFDRQKLKNTMGIKAATIQGWLRTFGHDGQVHEMMPPLSFLKSFDIVIMSNDDIARLPEFLPQVLNIVPMVVVTENVDGVHIYLDNKVHHFPSFRTDSVDPTGAGDIFATAFLCSYTQRKSIQQAASFAHSAASLSIEGVGISSIPTLKQILNRQQLYLKKYL